MITAKNGSLITGGLSVLIIGAVFLTAIIVRVSVTGATYWEKYQKENNSNQSNTAPTNRSRSSLPENNYNSYSSSNSYSSGSYNNANSYTAPTSTPAPTMSNSYSANTYQEIEKPSTTSSQFNGRIIADDIYIDPFPTSGNPNPESFYVPKGESIKILCRSSSLIYRIKTRDGSTSEINGYAIEFTTEDKQVPSCSSYNEKGSF